MFQTLTLPSQVFTWCWYSSSSTTCCALNGHVLNLRISTFYRDNHFKMARKKKDYLRTLDYVVLHSFSLHHMHRIEGTRNKLKGIFGRHNLLCDCRYPHQPNTFFPSLWLNFTDFLCATWVCYTGEATWSPSHALNELCTHYFMPGQQ